MSVEFSNAYQEILLDNFNSVIKQNMLFQTQLRMSEEAQKNNKSEDKINLLYRDGTMIDIADAADQLNISVLSTTVEKFFMCYPKECVVKD